jgi:hypothetical protein
MGRPPNPKHESDDRERHGHEGDKAFDQPHHGHDDSEIHQGPAPEVADNTLTPGRAGPDEAPPLGDPTFMPTAEVPAVKTLNVNQTGMLGIEALEGYFYGQRTRTDHNGMLWDFRRESGETQWRLVIRVTFMGVRLAEAALPLDQVASKEGEERVLATVETMAKNATIAAKALRERQQAMRSEAAEKAES